jgi:hypothetical protein
MTRVCSWCGKSFADTVTRDEHTVGLPWQEVDETDIPTLCLTCAEEAKL